MPRGKRSSSESSEFPDESASAEEGLKTRGAAKVTLVKPMKTSETMPGDELKSGDIAEIVPDSEPSADLPQPEKAPRPKVGRSSSTRKKKSDGTDTAAEKKPRKPRKKPAAVIAAEALPQDAVSLEEKPAFMAPVTAETQTPSVAAPIIMQDTPKIAEEMKLPIVDEPVDELPSDWTPEQHSRPQSFKSILFAVILFVLINLGFMTLFSASHKPKTAAPDVTKAAVTLPSIPSANFSGQPAVPLPGTDAVTDTTTTPAPVVSVPEEKAAAPLEPVTANPAEVRTLPPSLPAAPTEASAPMRSPVTAESAPVTSVTETTLAPTPTPGAEIKPSATPAPAAIATPPAASPENKAASSSELLSILDKN